MSASTLGVSFLVLVFGTIAGALVASEVMDRQARRQALAKLDSYEWNDQRERALAEGWKTRLALPLVQSITDRIRRFTPDGFREKAARKLAAAGMNGEQELDRFLALRIAALAAILPAALAVLAAFGTDTTGLAVTGLVVLMLAIGPTTMVSRKADERQTAIARSLPDVLDLLTISVEAGLGFEQAVDRVVASVPGPLTDEFTPMLGEVRAGARRADALRAMSMRVDVTRTCARFVLAVLQADTFGVSIGRMLRNQSDEIRVRVVNTRRRRRRRRRSRCSSPWCSASSRPSSWSSWARRSSTSRRTSASSTYGEAVSGRRSGTSTRASLFTDSVVVVTGALIAFRLGLIPIKDNSAFTHLATGIHMVAKGWWPSIPRVDPYTYTALGHDWVVQSWLASWAVGLAERLFGLHAVLFLSGCAYALTAGLMGSLARTRSAPRTAAVVALTLTVASQFWAPRPLMVGLICFALHRVVGGPAPTARMVASGRLGLGAEPRIVPAGPCVPRGPVGRDGGVGAGLGRRTLRISGDGRTRRGCAARGLQPARAQAGGVSAHSAVQA